MFPTKPNHPSKQGRTDNQGISGLPLVPKVQNSNGAPPPQDSTHRLLSAVPGSKRRQLSSSDGTPTVSNGAPLVMIGQEMAPLVSCPTGTWGDAL